MIFASQFGEVPPKFGRTKRVLRLGVTTRTQTEFEDYLSSTVLPVWGARSYHVLKHNCNHFSEELVQFLLNGEKSLPEEIILQPEWAQNSRLVRLLVPTLNRELGTFGQGNDSQALWIDDLTEEWRARLQKGDLVLRRHKYIDRPVVTRILDIRTSPG